ncbi:hypothetical protein G9A89_007999 [Geosiphon pyriformis]|nr:hypothetical protein G9A89_007999 [Geosiphon pyriformis]
MLRKGLKLKANIFRDFSSKTILHSGLYELKLFEQMQTECLMTGLVDFANLGDIFGSLFKYRVMDLQAISWMLWQSLSFLVKLLVNSINCFLIDVTNMLASCGSSLINNVSNVFQAGSSVPVLDVLSIDCIFCDIGFVNKQLVKNRSGEINVYTDESIMGLGFVGTCGGTTAYFSDIDLSNLLVSWNKVKRHLGVVGNKHANFFASAATKSKFVLSVSITYCFIVVKGRPVSENACYSVRSLFEAVSFVGWKSKYTSVAVNVNLNKLIDMCWTFSIWHSDDRIYSGFFSSVSMTLRSYFMKALHYQLLIVKRKKLYRMCYPNILCIWCGLVKDFYYIFLCIKDSIVKEKLISDIIGKWADLLSVGSVDCTMTWFLHEAESFGCLYIALAKDFIIKE